MLLIFQTMDAAGKNGAIRHVTSGVNPQGCQVFSFKHPSAQELDHDFLWRTYLALPERNGTRNIKFFLHLSREEQRRRFLERIDDPDKNWKLGSADMEQREALGRLHEGVRRLPRRQQDGRDRRLLDDEVFPNVPLARSR